MNATTNATTPATTNLILSLRAAFGPAFATVRNCGEAGFKVFAMHATHTKAHTVVFASEIAAIEYAHKMVASVAR